MFHFVLFPLIHRAELDGNAYDNLGLLAKERFRSRLETLQRTLAAARTTKMLADAEGAIANAVKVLINILI